MSTTILQIRKDHLPTTRWHERADEPLASGQVRVRIDRFAPVSYTHLDVYKRQSKKLSIMRLLTISPPFGTMENEER